MKEPLQHLSRHQPVRGIGLILIGSALFGAMAVCIGLAAREMNPPQITFVRFAGSLAVLLALGRGRGLRLQVAGHRPVLLRGLLGAAASVLYYFGIAKAGPAFATLLQSTYPIFTTLFATTLMDERFSPRLGVALAVSILGVVIVLGPGADLTAATSLGGLSALLAGVLAGGAIATARHLRLTESAFLVTTYYVGIGAVCTAPSLLLGLPTASATLLLALAGMVATSVVGQLLLHQGLGLAPASQGSLAAATGVVTAAVLQAFWLGDHLSYQTILGGSLLILAVGLAVSRR